VRKHMLLTLFAVGAFLFSIIVGLSGEAKDSIY
jgi:hypothetical protein